jgi:methyl-accepting chemotaxis protein
LNQAIAGLIEDIKKRADHAVAATGKGMQRAEHGKNLAGDTQGTFGEIFQLLNGISSQIDTVAESTRTMAVSNQAMIDSINLIATISKRSLESTEEVSAMT